MRKVALLTAGGFAPCLSAAIGGLIERYSELAPEVEIIGYRHGYQGLLSGDILPVTPGRAGPRPAAARVRRVPAGQLQGEADQRQGPGQARAGRRGRTTR